MNYFKILSLKILSIFALFGIRNSQAMNQHTHAFMSALPGDYIADTARTIYAFSCLDKHCNAVISTPENMQAVIASIMRIHQCDDIDAAAMLATSAITKWFTSSKTMKTKMTEVTKKLHAKIKAGKTSGIPFILKLNPGLLNFPELEMGYTLLMQAAWNGNEKLIKALLEFPDIGVNIQNKAEGKNCALRLAIEAPKENENIVEQLLAAGATSTADGACIISACFEGRFKTVQKLVLSGKIDFHITDNLGLNGLIISSGLGHLDIVKFLCKNKIDINAQSRFGFDALMCAAKSNHPLIVQELLDYGANPYTKDLNGDTALDYAKRSGSAECIKILKPYFESYRKK